MKKTLIGVALCLALLFSLALPGLAAAYETPARELNGVGLFQGTDQGFELDRAATRVEAGVMLVRLLGAERKALELFEAGDTEHPFTDVPDWADAHVAWLYTEGLTRGVGETSFGAGDCTAQMYCTFLLRALGYSEADGDFTYAGVLEKAAELRLYDGAYLGGDLLRDQVAALSYQALATDVKGGETSLLAALVKDGAVDAKAAGDLLKKQEVYREYALAAAASEAQTSVAMTVAALIDMDIAGQDEAVSMVTVMDVATIVDGADIQAEIAGVITADGQETSFQEWIKDGWVYMDMDGVQYKMAMDLPEAMSLVGDNTAGMRNRAEPFYLIDDIVKNEDGSFTIVYGEAFNEFAAGLLNQINLGDALAVRLGPVECTVSFDDKGMMDEMSLTMTVDLTAEIGGEDLSMHAAYDLTGAFTAWGDDVQIAFPDFSGFEELAAAEAA